MHWSNWLRMANKKEAFEYFIEKLLCQSRYLHIYFSGRGWSFSKCLHRQGVVGYPIVYVCLWGVDGWSKIAKVCLRSCWMPPKKIKLFDIFFCTVTVFDSKWMHNHLLNYAKAQWFAPSEKVKEMFYFLWVLPTLHPFDRINLTGSMDRLGSMIYFSDEQI